MSIPAKTDQMRGVGRELNEKMQNMYDKIRELHEFWYGERYNRLEEGFNKIRPSVNNIVELLFTQLPSSLDTIANNYSKLDRSMNIRTVSDEKPRIIEELPKYIEIAEFISDPSRKAKDPSKIVNVIANAMRAGVKCETPSDALKILRDYEIEKMTEQGRTR